MTSASSILFVCLGNICRSPTADAVLRQLAADRGLNLEIDSCGTAAYHIGKQPDSRAIKAANSKGYDLKPLRARQITPQDFETFDLILAMDRNNLSDITSIAPAGARAKTALFLDYAEDTPTKDVPDPYYTGTFPEVLELIETTCKRLLDEITA